MSYTAANSRGRNVLNTSKRQDFAALDRLPKRLRRALVEATWDLSAEQMEQMLHTVCEDDVDNALFQIRMNDQALSKPFYDFLKNPRRLEFDEDGLPLYS